MEIELFKWKGFKLPKTVYRKLGKEQAWGRFDGDNTIEIDSTLRGKKALEIGLHEIGHFIFTEMSEEDIIKNSRIITEFLWREGYRKIDNKE